MNHREIQERVDSYLDLELAPNERRDFEDHLAACAECAGAVERQRRISRAVFRRSSVPNTDIFVDRVMARIRAAANEPVSVFAGFWKWPALGLAALATALILTIPRESVAPPEQVCSTRNVLLADSAGRLVSTNAPASEPVDAILDMTEQI